MIPIRDAIPLGYPPIVTWVLIALNCAVFLFEASLSATELDQFRGPGAQ